jgi:beta-glucosidase
MRPRLRPGQRTASSVIALTALLLSGTPAMAGTPAAASGQPWRTTSWSAERRADSLLGAMTLQEKVTLITAVDPADYAPLEHLGIPALTRVDASSGLRGDTGVTAFPVPIALGASFDRDLAQRYGDAIGAEARGKGWNVLLGPTMDIDRTARSGREEESYGEDPRVSGTIGAAVAEGFQDNAVISQLKHFTAYNQENDRNTLDARVSQRALHEVYYAPFEQAIREGGADSVMCSYPKINGTYACANKPLLTDVKTDLGLRGYVGTDFRPSVDYTAAIQAGVDSAALMPGTPQQPFLDGTIPLSRTNDAARRILYAVFDTGLFDHPVTTTPAAVVTTAVHQALARETAAAGTVLLKNNQGILPLAKNKSVAVIGPAGQDTVTGVEGSTYVDPGDFTTPVEAITAKVGASRVRTAQGSLGDGVELTTLRAAFHADFYAGTDFAGAPIRTAETPTIDFRPGTPVDGLPAAWSGRWTGTVTPATGGDIRFAAPLSGSVKVTVGGTTVIDSTRFLWDFFIGPKKYVPSGSVKLAAGKPVKVTVEYSTKGAGWDGTALTLQWQPHSLIPAAVAAAKRAGAAVVYADIYQGEGIDRDNLVLPGDQNQLIEAVAAANPHTVVVLNTPGPVLMPWLSKVRGVVQTWHQGAASGTGAADVLYGDAEPGGRLPVTFPASDAQGLPAYDFSNVVDYDEGVDVGYRRYARTGQKPLFPFGYGLSYTTFGYSHLRTSGLTGRHDTTPTVEVTVRNTGRRSGSDVVQVYVGHLPTAVDTPVKSLAGFTKVTLQPGRQRTVRVVIDRRALSYYDEHAGQWVTPRGSVPLYVGRSATDVQLAGRLTVS